MEQVKQTSTKIFGQTRISVLTSRLIRFEYDPNSVFENRASQIVVNRQFPLSDWAFALENDVLTVQTDDSKIWVNLRTQEISAIKPNDGHIWHWGEDLHNLGGTARTLDNADGQVELDDGIFTEEGLFILEDSSCLLNEEGAIFARGTACKDYYIFLYGRDFEQGLKDFYQLCGSVPLLPEYALGNWWSRFWPYKQSEYLDLMMRFQEENLPFSVAVLDMDWHLTKVPDNCNGWTGFTWNKELIPEPEYLLNSLHEKGLHVTLNLHPAAGVQFFEEQYCKMCDELGLDSSSKTTIPFDFTTKEFRHAYFKNIIKSLEEQGVDFWWIDWQQGTESKIKNVDPLWLLNHYHFQHAEQTWQTKSLNNCLILSRYAGLGSHRYPVGFSGDTIASWQSLAFQPYFTATAANCGYSWWSHDIGGHMQGCKDDELACRWLQFGVFSPINRLHSTANMFAGKEPWNYRTDIALIMGDFLRLRAKLLPYLQAMNYRCHLEGLPLVRPMYHVWPTQKEAFNCPNQYYFGSELIVAPVVSKMDEQCNLASSTCWLPDGIYFDYFTGVRYKGGHTYQMFRPLENLPVLAKAGAIIPLVEEADQISLRIYPEADGAFTLYSENQAIKEIAKTQITLDWTKQSVTIKNDSNNLTETASTYKLYFCGLLIDKVRIELNGIASSLSVRYDTTLQASVVQIQVPAACASLSVNFQVLRDLQMEIRERCLRNYVHNAKVSFDLQEKIYLQLKETKFTDWTSHEEQIPPILEAAMQEILPKK